MSAHYPLVITDIKMPKKVSESNATVLIIGESGTGKELLARRIHNKSERRDYPFVAVNCAAIPKELIESELFGHVKGAFSGAVKDHRGKFENANNGTLFLDEVAELPVSLQPRLLCVLQENIVDVVGKETPVAVDVRVIAATNRELEEEIKKGNFREDLFYRLNVFPIKIPPLCERKEEIPILVELFLKRYGREKTYTLFPGLLKKLENYRWPGNVRELENIIQRMTLLADSNVLTEDLLPEYIVDRVEEELINGIELPREGISLDNLTRDVIIHALKINNYNQTKTAQFLKIPRHVLLYRIEKYNIPLKEK